MSDAAKVRASEWVGQRVGEVLSDDGCSETGEAESAYGKD